MANDKAKKPSNTGRFAKGNKAATSKGHAHAKKLKHAEAFKAAITIKDVKDIAKVMLKEALKGDARAAQFIMDRCAGKPAQALELTGAEGGPLAIQIMQFGGVDDSKP